MSMMRSKKKAMRDLAKLYDINETNEKFEDYYDAMLTDTIFEATQFPHCDGRGSMILMRLMQTIGARFVFTAVFMASAETASRLTVGWLSK